MFKTCITLAVTFFILFSGFNSDAIAATKKSKKKITKTTAGKFQSHYGKTSKRRSVKKMGKRSKSKKHKRGSSVDLKALTTESPFTDFTDKPDNGVNPIETKPGIY
jgi:hypothetical protein